MDANYEEVIEHSVTGTDILEKKTSSRLIDTAGIYTEILPYLTLFEGSNFKSVILDSSLVTLTRFDKGEEKEKSDMTFQKGIHVKGKTYGWRIELDRDDVIDTSGGIEFNSVVQQFITSNLVKALNKLLFTEANHTTAGLTSGVTGMISGAKKDTTATDKVTWFKNVIFSDLVLHHPTAIFVSASTAQDMTLNPSDYGIPLGTNLFSFGNFVRVPDDWGLQGSALVYAYGSYGYSIENEDEFVSDQMDRIDYNKVGLLHEATICGTYLWDGGLLVGTTG